MRIDFVLASPALAARVTGASIDREERKGKGASDHAPVHRGAGRLMSSPGPTQGGRPMTGNLYRGQAGLPFSSALRVYEPLDAFPEEQRGALQAAGARTRFPRRRRKRRTARLPRPHHPPGGDPFPTGRTDLVGSSVPRTGTRPPAARRGRESDAGSRRRAPDRTGCCCTAPASWCCGPGLAANALMEGIHGPLAELLIPEEQRDKHQERIDR